MKSKIPELMKKHGYTIRKLEEESGISHVTILRTRSSIDKCRLDTLHKIAAVLGVKIDDLFTDDPDTD
jgi:transcriptional regulator with XRE-family HTH domain